MHQSVLGIAEDCSFLSAYHSSTDYGSLRPFIFRMNVTWGWALFAVNTIMTSAIVVKILLVKVPYMHVCSFSLMLLFFMSSLSYHNRIQPTIQVGQRSLPFQISLHVLCESAVVTWIGLALLELASLKEKEEFFEVSIHSFFATLHKANKYTHRVASISMMLWPAVSPFSS